MTYTPDRLVPPPLPSKYADAPPLQRAAYRYAGTPTEQAWRNRCDSLLRRPWDTRTAVGAHLLAADIAGA